MSDYLTRLLERSMGVAPQIEPLIAPLHAPPAQSLDLEPEPIARIAPAGDAETKVSDGAAEPGDAPDATASAPDKLRSPEKPASRLQRQPAAFPARPAIGKREEFRETKRPALRTGAAPGQPAPEPSHPVALPLAPSQTLGEQRTGIVPRPAIAERPASSGSPPRSPELAAQAAPTMPGPNRIFVQPQITARRQAAAFSPPLPRQATSNEPPAIHVTIGRVEVRAIMATPPPPTPSTPPPVTPKISLEEYLKQRNGGRR